MFTVALLIISVFLFTSLDCSKSEGKPKKDIGKEMEAL